MWIQISRGAFTEKMGWQILGISLYAWLPVTIFLANNKFQFFTLLFACLALSFAVFVDAFVYRLPLEIIKISSFCIACFQMSAANAHIINFQYLLYLLLLFITINILVKFKFGIGNGDLFLFIIIWQLFAFQPVSYFLFVIFVATCIAIFEAQLAYTIGRLATKSNPYFSKHIINIPIAFGPPLLIASTLCCLGQDKCNYIHYLFL